VIEVLVQFKKSVFIQNIFIHGRDKLQNIHKSMKFIFGTIRVFSLLLVAHPAQIHEVFKFLQNVVYNVLYNTVIQDFFKYEMFLGSGLTK